MKNNISFFYQIIFISAEVSYKKNDCTYTIYPNMEHLNTKFDNILITKREELLEALSKKSKALTTDECSIDDIGFCAKSTLSKINAEQERKYKASKTYKKKTEYSDE